MDGMPEYVVDPNMRFSDIIVPTVDTVRAHFLLELLISNVKQVGCRSFELFDFCIHIFHQLFTHLLDFTMF